MVYILIILWTAQYQPRQKLPAIIFWIIFLAATWAAIFLGRINAPCDKNLLVLHAVFVPRLFPPGTRPVRKSLGPTDPLSLIPMEPQDLNRQNSIEALWDAILSRIPGQILNAVKSLNQEDRRALLAHLSRMATEEGWHPEQAESARVALQTLSREQDH